MKPVLSENTSFTHVVLGGVASGAQGLVLGQILSKQLPLSNAACVLHVCVNDRDAKSLLEVMPFFAPDAECIYLPAWDCLPYDRVSPHPAITAERVQALIGLRTPITKPRLIITTVNSVLQLLPPKEVIADASLVLEVGKNVTREALVAFFMANGYLRVEKAMEVGEYALRGSIVDVIPPGDGEGLRIDFFGDEVESLRSFEPISQRSQGAYDKIILKPTSEIILNEARVEHFRKQYRDLFGAISKEDPLYEAISSGQKYPGMEHWMALFYERMDTLFDYIGDALITLDLQVQDALRDRFETIADYYSARVDALRSKIKDTVAYHPVPPEKMYLLQPQWERLLDNHKSARFSAFETESQGQVVPMHIRGNINFAALRTNPSINPFEQLREFATNKREAKKSTLLTCLSQGSASRLFDLLAAQGAHCITIQNYKEIKKISGGSIGLAVLPLERGFETPELAVVSEQDLLGERVIRSKGKKRSAEMFLQEAANFSAGELVVHREHGIGRFEGLITLEIMGAQHDCLKLIYEGDDKLFLPVENIDLISRYGTDEGAKLDKLGSASWQARKARLKERIKLAAEELIKTAAERAVKTAPEMTPQQQMYQEFCARFPYVETEDQERAIEDVLEDLRSGAPMDRLICGDVGFGKTEVAMRAAFAAVTAHPAFGQEDSPARMQVAVIAPTTLLARQHYKNFSQRFEGFNINVQPLSRLVPAKKQQLVREGLKDGSVDIVVGTHALLAKNIEFSRLGLVIVDEEQHFGVAQKERLKALKADVHVLTLSATPIPRTLQMALTGVRSLSLITTPPVDRLAVRSFVMPFDPVVLREAIMREKNRGGRVFLVTPRIQDIGELAQKMRELVPEIKIAIAHGQMPPSDLDNIMNEFYDGGYDMLLSTAIIESGLDIPTANTMIIHRADRFGLSQLYQLRGRVGRGKIRAYAYFLLPAHKVLSTAATRRLEVMQTLDALGAGFTIASHDMDIRGFGNLVGEEQSGHIKEVGIELYQQMLMEAVENLKASKQKLLVSPEQKPQEEVEEWSPQINLGTSVLIPEAYITDLQLRLSLYRRAASLKSAAELDDFAAELIDRFGQYPEEVKHLLAVVRIKQLCRACCIDKLDVGPKGALIAFRAGALASAEKLLAYVAKHPTHYKLRPDGKLFHGKEWKSDEQKITDVTSMLQELVKHV